MRIIPRKPASSKDQTQPKSAGLPEDPMPLSLKEKNEILAPYLDKNEDINKRDFMLGLELKIPARAVFLNQVVDKETFQRHVLEPLMKYPFPVQDELGTALISMLTGSGPSVSSVKTAQTLKEIIHHVFDGLLVVFVDGYREALVVDIHGGEFRTVDEPPGERTTRGPREGFIENLDINISMIRRRLRDPKLVVKKTMVGRRTRTPVAYLYIEDIASEEVVKDLRQRIDAIDVDGIMASGYLEQFLEKSPWSAFPQIWSSERPDRLASKLLEGRVVVIVHGTPLAFTVPTMALEWFQASEDYYERTVYGSVTRFTRFIAFFLAVSLPSLYIALFSFHPELVPFKLLLPVAQARSQVPFPVIIEVLIQEFIIQLTIESGLRLPGAIGQTVGVVAGIILGQAAIAANLASPAVIIVISVTTIATFVMPSSGMLLASRILRLPLIFVCGAFGIYGFSLAWLFIVIHVSSLEDFKTPYYAPFAPLRWQDVKDAAIRAPLWMMNKRPASIPVSNLTRQVKTHVDGQGDQ
ncbi:MAG: spore germination protein [Syntrophomonadaceae bacterium]